MDSDQTQDVTIPVVPAESSVEAKNPEIPETTETPNSGISDQPNGSKPTDLPPEAPESPINAPTPIPVESDNSGLNQPESKPIEPPK